MFFIDLFSFNKWNDTLKKKLNLPAGGGKCESIRSNGFHSGMK